MPDREPEVPPRLLRGSLDIRSLALTGLFPIALVACLRIGRSFFVPVVAALLASFTLKPIVDAFTRLRSPRPLAAALVVALLLGSFGLGARVLYEPATEWIRGAPTHLSKLEYRLRTVREPIERVEQASEAVERIRGTDDDDGSVTVRKPRIARSSPRTSAPRSATPSS